MKLNLLVIAASSLVILSAGVVHAAPDENPAGQGSDVIVEQGGSLKIESGAPSQSARLPTPIKLPPPSMEPADSSNVTPPSSAVPAPAAPQGNSPIGTVSQENMPVS